MSIMCDVCGNDYPDRELAIVFNGLKARDAIHKCKKCMGLYAKYQLADLRNS